MTLTQVLSLFIPLGLLLAAGVIGWFVMRAPYGWQSRDGYHDGIKPETDMQRWEDLP